MHPRQRREPFVPVLPSRPYSISCSVSPVVGWTSSFRDPISRSDQANGSSPGSQSGTWTSRSGLWRTTLPRLQDERGAIGRGLRNGECHIASAGRGRDGKSEGHTLRDGEFGIVERDGALPALARKLQAAIGGSHLDGTALRQQAALGQEIGV